MKFKAGSRRRALEYEKDLVQQWKANKTFEKSVEQRDISNSYVFYDGPPFITGVPHHGTLLSSVVKDAVPRYWTMKGKHIERVWGWDSHGLPAENFVEKKLGISDRREIGTTISLEHYITEARDAMVANSATWEGVIDRVGRWVDFKGAYKTMDKNYMESVWWAFKTLYEKGKIYEGEKILMYDTKFATPVSKSEVTMDNDAYQTVTDPSVYVKFGLLDKDNIAKAPEKWLLAWTTTPWTLPGNTALAVNPALEYADVKLGDDVFVVANERIEKVFVDEKHQALQYEVLKTYSGTELVGQEYLELETSTNGRCSDDYNGNEFKIWAADYVTTDSGTGIVHLAPAYGEEDFELAKANNIPIVHVLDDNGKYLPGTDWEGLDVWETNKTIAKTLLERGDVWKIEYIQHEYPFNPRSKQRIMYRAVPSWFFDVEGQKELMLEQNEEGITWFPEHIKNGRFAKNIEQAPDWNLSRDRFWATGMPVWKSEDGDIKVIGSYAELEELSGQMLEDYHRPWVDQVEFDFEGKHYKRVEKVLDGWFESGSMPFAQFHYPFENKEKFEANFPGDFISEYVAQTRAWFYYLHVVNVGLFGKAPFKNAIVTGTVAGNDGRKMSKSLGNFTDPNELMDKFSADSLRFLLLSSPLLNGEDFSLQDKEVGDVARKLSMIWNMYDFFTMYADVDGWEWTGELEYNLDSANNPLDRWIVSRLHQLQDHVEKHMDGYNIPGALEEVLPFIDDASNWYVRRSRRRFWKSDDDNDKNEAYKTLHYVLVRLSMILAPFVPFLAEELYQKLTGGESVHLLDWPKAGAVDEATLTFMGEARKIIEQGLALRMFKSETEQQVKVRQPLAKLDYTGQQLDSYYEAIIAEEVNVKQVNYAGAEGVECVVLDKTITPELKREGLMREIVRFVQNARKDAGLNVDDRIVLSLVTDDQELQQSITEFAQTIQDETLTVSLETGEYSYQIDVKVEGVPLKISLQKAL